MDDPRTHGAPAGLPDDHRRPRITVAGIALAAATAVLVVLALEVHGQIVFGVAVLAIIFIPVEKLFALHPRPVLRRGWRTDVVHYLLNGVLVNAGLLVVVASIGGILRAAVPAALRAGVASQPAWAQLVEAFVIAGFGGYAGHRAAHQVPWLWRFHKVHHSIQELDWLAANHLHPVDQVFMRSCAVIPLYALGYGQASLGGFVVLTTLQSIFIHSNVRLRFGPLRWLIATPEFHHWHHADDPAAYDSNYAAEFPAIDALFGTLHLPRGQWPAGYGIDADQPEGYLCQLAWPLRRDVRA